MRREKKTQRKAREKRVERERKGNMRKMLDSNVCFMIGCSQSFHFLSLALALSLNRTILLLLIMYVNSIRFIFTLFSSFFSTLKKNNCILFRLCYDKIKSKMNFIQRREKKITKNRMKGGTAYLSIFHSCE